jgi:sugar phosphate isomerase/epimerase
MNPLIMHINYCEQGQTIPEICEKAAAWGFSGVEFRQKPGGGLPFSGTEAYLSEVAESARKFGLTKLIFAVRAAGVCSADAAVRGAAVKGAVKFITAANRIAGAKLFNAFAEQFIDRSIPYGPDYLLHGSALASPEDWQRAAECFAQIGAAAEKLGVRLAFETHMSYLHDTPAASAKLVKLIGSPAVGINMDYGNTIYFAGRPSVEECIALYGGKIFDIHLKNSVGLPDGGRIPTSLGGGEINHRQYLRLLKNAGYEGPVTLEAPRPGDREHFAKEDIAYYKSVRREVGFV